MRPDAFTDESGNLRCIDDHGESTCRGPVEWRRSPYNPLGSAFPRCEQHFDEVLDKHEETNRRYPDSPTPPAWFDPADAGERWDYDY